MKELNNQTIDKIEIQAEQQQRKEIKLIGQLKKIAGLTLFEYNTTTKEVKPATYSKVDYKLESLSEKPEEMQVNYKVLIREECMYIQALNKKNALKKINKHLQTI